MSAQPVKVLHIGDVTSLVANYFVKLDDGRCYAVDRRHSDRALRIRMIPSRRCVTLSRITVVSIGLVIDGMQWAGVLSSEDMEVRS